MFRPDLSELNHELDDILTVILGEFQVHLDFIVDEILGNFDAYLPKFKAVISDEYLSFLKGA